MDLILPLNGEYFDQIKAGTKTEEYRLVNDYWRARLYLKNYDRVIVTRGYPKRTDNERRLAFPYRGYTIKKIIHPHFGAEPVHVFAIGVGSNVEVRGATRLHRGASPRLPGWAAVCEKNGGR